MSTVKNNQEINEILSNNAELLAKFKIRTRYYITSDKDDIQNNFIIAGGTEVLRSTANDDNVEAMLEDIGIAITEPVVITDSKSLPFKYVEVPFDKAKLKELLVHKEIDSYSKEDALKLNKDIKSKDELENNIVYITDKVPMTNTLALTKQFNLGHREVIKKLYELGSMYPSVLMQMKYDVYNDDVKSGGMKTNTEDSESVIPVEYSTGIKSHILYASFVHITEDVYYKFVKKISTPKGIASTDLDKRDKALAKLIHIESKQDEYFEAFTKVRDFLLESGTSSKELEAMMRARTRKTKELMSETYDFVTKHNEFDKDNKLPLINFNKLIFNIVNYINNINAVNYVPPTKKELKDNFNRKTKDEILQEDVMLVEQALIPALRVGGKYHATLLDILTSATKMTEDEIYSALKEYNADYLLDLIKPK